MIRASCHGVHAAQEAVKKKGAWLRRLPWTGRQEKVTGLLGRISSEIGESCHASIQ